MIVSRMGFLRLETRMTADINVILQLLQSQITPVPPAYSTVSPGNHPPNPTTLYGPEAPALHGMYTLQNQPRDSRASSLPVLSTSGSDDEVLVSITSVHHCDV